MFKLIIKLLEIIRKYYKLISYINGRKSFINGSIYECKDDCKKHDLFISLSEVEEICKMIRFLENK